MILDKELQNEEIGLHSTEWEELHFPCVAVGEDDILGRVEGEPLLPFRNGSPFRDLTWVEQTQHSMLKSRWECMYQGNPIPTEEDADFKLNYFQFVDVVPDSTRTRRRIISWDFNFKGADKHSDYIVGCVIDIIDGVMYPIHLYRNKVKFEQLVEDIKELNYQFNPNYNLIEAKANGHAIIETLQGQVNNIIPINPKDSKEQRIISTIPDIRTGKVLFVKNKDFNKIIIDEYRAFPRGKHDDVMDTITQAVIWYRSTNQKPIKVTKGASPIINILRRR
jgi:predicted phage terminase large subunit-like protein